ncbi:MAG: EFR1 family ferrodoxin [Candidatus Omnitrophica bacterium]|nr:EFR1 family ferrodoxin [Candidatus Omnitrophota bacterium]
MKTMIYYFSATGNSLVVARDLAQELGGAEIVSIPKAMKSGAEVSSDIVGIVFPAYMFGLPLIITSFLKMLKVKKGAYVFAVVTFGGIPGRPFMLAKKILADRGITLASGFGVLMPGNYVPLYGAIPQEQQTSMFDGENKRVKEIADAVRAQKTGIFEEKAIVLGTLFHVLLYKGGSSQIPQSDKNFWVTDDCTSCGLCAKVCPVNNITMNNGRPEWQHHCEHCMACLQWCPVEAIQYKKNTVGRKRYHHPAVKSGDIEAGQPQR